MPAQAGAGKKHSPVNMGWLIFYFINLNALSMHFFFCSRFGCTYRLSVVPIFEWPSSTLTVL